MIILMLWFSYLVFAVFLGLRFGVFFLPSVV